jgi:hypothetical protein
LKINACTKTVSIHCASLSDQHALQFATGMNGSSLRVRTQDFRLLPGFQKLGVKPPLPSDFGASSEPN